MTSFVGLRHPVTTLVKAFTNLNNLNNILNLIKLCEIQLIIKYALVIVVMNKNKNALSLVFQLSRHLHPFVIVTRVFLPSLPNLLHNGIAVTQVLLSL